MFTFTVNGKVWGTDKATLELLRQYKNSGNSEMFGVVFEIGVAYGRIRVA